MTTLVIGAGVAGAAAAHVCLDATVCEATDRTGGRMDTRTHDGTVYDLGLGTVRDTGDERSTVVRELLGPDCTAFDGRVVGPDGDPVEPGAPTRLTGDHGLAQIPETLLDEPHCEVRTDTAVRRLDRTRGGWRAHTDAGVFDADRVVTTTAAAETANLLADDPLSADLRRAAERAERRSLDAVALGYEGTVDRDWYAMAPGDDHPVRCVRRESAKPGHVPPGREALVVHLDPDWAAEHAPDAAVDCAARAVAGLLGAERLATPDWTDHERYDYARPDQLVDPELVERAAEADLHLAGGWVAGTRRTFTPLETGLDAGRRAMGFEQQAAMR